MYSRYGPSLNASHSIIGPDFLGFNFGLSIRTETIDTNNATKAAHRTAHGNPIRGIRYWIVAGKMTLPKPVPVAEMASAEDRFVTKYELMTDSGGMKMMPRPNPVHNPWARKICQYSLQRLVMKVPNTTINEPTMIVDFTYPASASLPEKVHIAKARKTCRDPIHEIWASGSLRVSR